MRKAALAALLLLIAGCTSGPSQETPTAAPTTSAPPVTDQVGYAFCEGFHTFFPSPTAGFAALVPENFTIDMRSPGTVDVPVFAFDCANGTAEIWALLPVVPPAQYRNESYSIDALVLQAYTTNVTGHDRYLSWGLAPNLVRLAKSTSTDYNDGGAAHLDTITLGDNSTSYGLRVAAQGMPAPFPAAQYRYWVANGTHAIGSIEARASPSTSLGAGPATFQQEGDPAAPLATAGQGHRVLGVAMQLTWHPL